MSTAALPFDQWQLLFHEAMAAIIRSKEAIKRQAGILGVAKGLWTAARDLKNIVQLERVMLEVPDGVIDEATLRANIQSTSELLRSIEELIDIAKQHRLQNRTLTAASLESVRRSGEQIADHLDVLKISIDPDVEELIRQGRQDFAEGRSVPFESLHD